MLMLGLKICLKPNASA